MRYGDARVAALVAADPDLALGLAHQVLGAVLEQRDEEQELLVGTLRAWYDAEGLGRRGGPRCCTATPTPCATAWAS